LPGASCRAECIIQAALHGVGTAGATLYSTNHPCGICAKMIINAGIVSIVILDGYSDKLADEIFAEAGIQVKTL
jgi:dCMP deaminase